MKTTSPAIQLHFFQVSLQNKINQIKRSLFFSRRLSNITRQIQGRFKSIKGHFNWKETGYIMLWSYGRGLIKGCLGLSSVSSFNYLTDPIPYFNPERISQNCVLIYSFIFHKCIFLCVFEVHWTWNEISKSYKLKSIIHFNAPHSIILLERTKSIYYFQDAINERQ